MGKIVFDLSFVTNSIYTGVSKYAYRILEYIVNNEKQSNYILLLNIKSADYIKKMFPQFEYVIMGPIWLSRSKILNSFCNMLCFKKTVNKINANLVFCPSGGVYGCLSVKKKKIVVIHDMQIRIDAHLYSPFAVWVLKYAEDHYQKNSDYIFTISEHSRHQILHFYPNCEKKLINMSNVVEMPNVKNIDPMQPGFKYLLYVGRLCEMKNVMTLIKAFNKIHDKILDYKVVLLSNTDAFWFSKIEPYIKEKCIEDKVVFVKSCSETDLVKWYLGASVFVFPSLREGFGFPPIEAGLLKIPVISSKSDSLEEVTLGLLNYYEPANSEEALSDCIIKVISNPPSKQQLENVQIEYKKHYSLDVVAKKIVDFLEKES